MNPVTHQSITMGIDAGGTFTDLVLLDSATKSVLRQVKIPTCHHDMLSTLRQGISTILEGIPAQSISMVNFATTFATNAIVEHKTRPTHLILIGYGEGDVAEVAKQTNLSPSAISHIRGGHTVHGEELEPLDESALTAVIHSLPQSITSIALSSFFSIRNPSHELRAIQLIQKIRPKLSTSCGHQLSWELNAIKRATTATLNAGLIPMMMELLDNLVEILHKQGISAHLNVIRGDGTTVNQHWAKFHPVELLLSGPAASAVGAGFLAHQQSADGAMWICDIGGTTTDIIQLDEAGKPTISNAGATIGAHQTLVKSIDIFTFGQGGDSHVALWEHDDLYIGPMRVQPLSSTAAEYPSVLDDLQRLAQIPSCTAPLFVLPITQRTNLHQTQEKLLAAMENRPISLDDLGRKKGFSHVNSKYLLELATCGLISLAGFTPTDAFHILGTFQRWNRQAAHLGASILCHKTAVRPEQLATDVQNKMTQNIANALFRKSIASHLPKSITEPQLTALLDWSLSCDTATVPAMALHLNQPLVGAGAPAQQLIPQVATSLHTACLLSDQGQVAGAIGAAVGTYSFAGYLRISHPEKELFRLHHPTGILDFSDLELAVATGQEMMEPWLTAQAKAAGVPAVQIAMERQDIVINATIHLWTELHFTVIPSS